ncbi:complement C1q-like protein 2 [Mya arenaria]|uniref:complement C1q-like protein 2 n=1 Tax=Mya arenaria TaxID=6604 RepID=UPI0022E33FBB|nr:complement C1q-like protein 2 [Mya arenaria]
MTRLHQLLLLVSMTVAYEPSCPACSKYDNEEKMLKRIIRMEFAYEKVLKENKDTKSLLHWCIFHARSPQTSILSTGEVIVYKTVETNLGNGYSSTTGKFTAPTRGLYLFCMHTCTATHKYASLQIIKEGSVLIASVHYDQDQYTCSSSQVFVYLDAGETVWVQCSSGGSNIQLYENSYRWTSFGGALIHN